MTPSPSTRSRSAAALAGGLTVALLAGCGSTAQGAGVGSRSAATGASPASAGVRAATAPASTAVATAKRAVAIYYLADSGAGPRLYREFHARPVTRSVVRDAVDAMLHEAPYDRDYASLWPRATRVLGVTVSGDLATVNLSREALRGSAGSAYELASVQQLVWTVIAAAPSVQRVRVLIEGKSSGRIDGRDIGDFWGAGGLAVQPLRRAAQYEILGPVWVLQPVTAATVGRDVTISGTESAFEGTVSWEVRSGGTVVKRGSATGVGAPARGPWSVTVRLAPGSYTVRGYVSSAKDGSVTFPDDKSFTVR